MPNIYDAISDLKNIVREFEYSSADSSTKSRHIEDGIYSMYIVLVPVEEGALVLCIDEKAWGLDSRFILEDIEIFSDYEKAEKHYEAIEL